jgi:hypothetical protein
MLNKCKQSCDRGVNVHTLEEDTNFVLDVDISYACLLFHLCLIKKLAYIVR